MYNLFEPGNLLNSPYEAFLFDTEKTVFLCGHTGIIIWRLF